MRKLWLFLVSALTVLAFVITPTSAGAATASPEGLWGTDVTPVNPAAGDTNSVELGVKFETSRPIYVVGVRFYRADEGTWSGSLWDADSTFIARADDSTAGTGWQTAMFASPQLMVQGDTFVASYFAPTGRYAYEYGYYATPRTVGAVTALGGAAVNGLFTYGPDSAFPTDTYLQSNYWVTPLWIPQYTLGGFYQPVDMGTVTNPVFNTVKGGSTVPLKFEVFDSASGIEQTDVAVIDKFEVKGIACPNASLDTDDIELVTTGGTSLRYDFTAGQFIQNWKTPKKAGSCYEVTVYTTDGSKISAKFMTK